jgi:hypothetical protein
MNLLITVIVNCGLVDPPVRNAKYKKETNTLHNKTRASPSLGNVLDELLSTVKYAQPTRPLLQVKSILRIFPARYEAVKYKKYNNNTICHWIFVREVNAHWHFQSILN